MFSGRQAGWSNVEQTVKKEYKDCVHRTRAQLLVLPALPKYPKTVLANVILISPANEYFGS